MPKLEGGLDTVFNMRDRTATAQETERQQE
jgi:hypothetical protein